MLLAVVIASMFRWFSASRRRCSTDDESLKPMQPKTKDRVQREAEFYNGQQSRRDTLDSALSYLNDGIGRLQRNEAVRAAMPDAVGKQVLEIGSQTITASFSPCLA